jgi:hypothetical protein
MKLLNMRGRTKVLKNKETRARRARLSLASSENIRFDTVSHRGFPEGRDLDIEIYTGQGRVRLRLHFEGLRGTTTPYHMTGLQQV